MVLFDEILKMEKKEREREREKKLPNYLHQIRSRDNSLSSSSFLRSSTSTTVFIHNSIARNMMYWRLCSKTELIK